LAQYFQQHLRNITDRQTISVREIESGPVYDVRYKSKTASASRYLIIALNIYPYTGPMKDKLLHCLDLDFLPLRDLKIIFKEANGVQDMEVKGRVFKEIKIPDGRENIQFYEKRIAAITRQIPKIYKTFNLDKISRVEICNYDWVRALDPYTARKYGLLDEN
tara:strand:+ start:596 stop:1081 length:486 start_codon:yes stop_codon:yes gene_type:complete